MIIEYRSYTCTSDDHMGLLQEDKVTRNTQRWGSQYNGKGYMHVHVHV